MKQKEETKTINFRSKNILFIIINFCRAIKSINYALFFLNCKKRCFFSKLPFFSFFLFSSNIEILNYISL